MLNLSLASNQPQMKQDTSNKILVQDMKPSMDTAEDTAIEYNVNFIFFYFILSKSLLLGLNSLKFS